MNTYMKPEDRIALPIGQRPDDDSYVLEAVAMTQSYMDKLDASVVRPKGTVLPKLRLYGGVEVKVVPEYMGNMGNIAIWKREARAHFTERPYPYVRDEYSLAQERRGYQAWLDELKDLPGGDV